MNGSAMPSAISPHLFHSLVLDFQSLCRESAGSASACVIIVIVVTVTVIAHLQQEFPIWVCPFSMVVPTSHPRITITIQKLPLLLNHILDNPICIFNV